MSANNNRLIGIKAIADYLKTSDRNVYRWEEELGLPLHRVAGSKGRSVYADIEELDRWINSRISSTSIKLVPRIPIRFFSIGLLIIALILIIMSIFLWDIMDIMGSKRSFKDAINPVTSTFEGNTIFIKEQNGNILTNYITSDGSKNLTWEKYKCIKFGDVDSDGLNEFVGRKYDTKKKKFFLSYFESNGDELWEISLTSEQKFNGIKYPSEYIPQEVRFGSAKDEKFILAYWRHRVRFISFICCYNLKGEMLNSYLNEGQLVSLETYDLDRDGIDEVLFSGTNNLLNGEAIVGVLDIRNFKGVSPPFKIEPEYRDLEFRLQRYVPDNPEYGNQSTYIRFQKTKYLRPYLISHVQAKLDGINPDLIHILIISWGLEFADESIGFQYLFNSKFKLLDIVPGAQMVKHFQTLQERQDIGITLKEFTDINKNNVAYWDNGNWIPVDVDGHPFHQ